jgi:hypothetical protein
MQGRYYFYSFGSERQAWRIIGIAARQCFELGLHRTEVYSEMQLEQAQSARLLFWSVFILDRCWSFGTGLPFAISEEEIDIPVPEPVGFLSIAMCIGIRVIFLTSSFRIGLIFI